jgi:hypothetical protein
MKEKYLEDIKEIKDIMNRSGRFISLSGLSGVSTGIIALIGLTVAYLLVFKNEQYLVHNQVFISKQNIGYLLLIALGTLLFSIGSAVFFTNQKIELQQQRKWNHQTKALLVNLLIPLVTGGIMCLLLLFKGFVGLLPALTLIFYGLALVNGSKYTLPEIKTLGFIQIVLGLLAFQFINYALYFWAIGFGLVQIIYGLIIQKKYKL